ncbi:MAG: alpha/beta hydrolase [Sphingomonadales bacterium]|nr:alpha/beta hydrolase [Sphingomonadales bacterium]MBK9004190.1 alpha/beta hydrolase [Sphingomonadales bacterium]MBP6434393.1 alpha/beta hydrolase [Sphingorhabdus sp.]
MPFLVAAMVAPAAIAAPWQLENSEVLTVRSDAGEDYQVMVAWPEGQPPANGWPVLWLLDGEDNFAMAAANARRLARARERSGVEPGLIVGIASAPLTRRSRDFTPAIDGYGVPPGTPGHGLPTGGADAFSAVLHGKIRPAVAARWKLDPNRQTLAGHSYGGLFAAHEMIAGGGFRNYALISPSLWYGETASPQRQPPQRNLAGRAVLIVEAAGDAPALARIARLEQRLTALGAQVQTLSLSDQNHGSTMAASIAHTITLAFGPEKTP